MPEPKPNPPAIQIPREKLEAEVLRILHAVDEAEGQLQAVRTSIEDNRELLLWQQERSDPPWVGATEAFLPTVAQTLEHLKVRVVDMLGGGDVVTTFTEENSEDREDAKRTERCVQQVFEKRLQFADKTLPRWVHSALQDKAGFLHVGWRTSNRKRRVWKQVREYRVDEEWLGAEEIAERGGQVAEQALPYELGGGQWQEMEGVDETGMPVLAPVFVPLGGEIPEGAKDVRDRWADAAVRAIAYDGPDLKLIEATRVGWWPVIGDDPLENASLIYYWVNESGRSVLERARSGEYDEAAVKELKEWQGEQTHKGSSADTKEELTSESSVNSELFHTRSFDMVEGYWPYAADDEGEPEDHFFTIHKDSEHAQRMAANPWWSGKRHVIAMTPLPHERPPWGGSVPEAESPWQESGTRLLRALIDGAQRDANPTLAYDTAMIDPEKRAEIEKNGLAPGTYIGFEGDPSKALLPLKPGVNSAAMIPALEFTKHEGEERLGVTEARKGAEASSRRTAFEVGSILAEGDVFITYLARQCGLAVAQLGQHIQDLCYQFAGNDSVWELWQLANPGTTQADMTRALGKKYTVSSAGSTESANAELVRSRLGAVFQLLLQCPYINSWELWRLLVQSFRLVSDPSTLIGTEEEAQEKDAQMAQMAQMQMEMQLQAASGEQEMEQEAHGAQLQRDQEEHDARLQRDDETHAMKLQGQAQQLDQQAVAAAQKLALSLQQAKTQQQIAKTRAGKK